MRVAKLVIIGQVQGVGFRRAAQSLAIQLELKGYVKNLDDGSVELMLEGKESNIKKFISELKNRFRIQEIKENWLSNFGKFSEFLIF